MNEGGMISKTSFMKTSSMPILHWIYYIWLQNT
jgi:hypothetical protein